MSTRSTDHVPPQALWAAALIAGQVASVVCGLAAPMAVGSAVTAVAQATEASSDSAVANGAVLVAAAVIGMGALADAVTGLAASWYATGSTRGVRAGLVRHLVALGPRATRAFPAGDLTGRIGTDAAAPGAALPTRVGVFVSLAGAVAALVALFVVDWRTGLAFVAGLPPVLLLVRRFAADTRGLLVEYRAAQSNLADRVLHTAAGARTIRAAGTLAAEVGRATAPVTPLAEIGRRLWHVQGRMVSQVSMAVPLMQVIVISTAGWGVAAGRLQPGGLVAAAGYAMLAFGGFETAESIGQLLQARVGAGRVREVLDLPLPGRASTPVDPGPLTVRVEGVTVHHEDRAALTDIDLVIPAGARYALVGAAGSGKSTLARVVAGLQDPSHGEVLLGETPLTQIDEVSLRSAVAFAAERPALLGDSLTALVALGIANPSELDLAAAATAARAGGFVDRLPQGWATRPDEAALSGGEWQRLGLAQALLRQARLLVLDDATSSLDMATEAEVLTALEEASTGRTALLVTHRASLAARCDAVVWLEAGRVRAVGPHADLALDPIYRDTLGMTEQKPPDIPCLVPLGSERGA